MAYADVSYYMDEYKGTVLTEENAGRYLDMASDVVDQLTFYRIHAILFENLTEFQKKTVRDANCSIADFSLENADLIESAVSSYSINGVSVGSGLSPSVKLVGGVYIPSAVYGKLLATGLCVPVCR